MEALQQTQSSDSAVHFQIGGDACDLALVGGCKVVDVWAPYNLYNE